MKSKLHLGALALLTFVACRQPDSALFDDSPPTAGSKGSGASAGIGASAGSGASGGTETGGSGSGGTASVAGTAPEGGAVDMPSGGSAGGPATAGTAGTSPDPTDAGAPGGGTGGSGSTGGSGGTGSVTGPVCGNGLIEAGEECDDEGHTGKDGCDANCQVECADFGSGAIESEDHHCYNGYDEGTWHVAQDECVKRGAHLATISSAAENKVVLDFVNNSKWIGGFEDVSVSSEGQLDYVWVTDEPFDYTNWARSEPDSARCSGFGTNCYEHCVAMQGDGKWADSRCETADGYVCEWDPPGM